MKPKLKTLQDAGSAVLADVLDTLGQLPPVLDNRLLSIGESGVRLAGPAYTITGETQSWSSGGDRSKLSAIDRMTAGVVSVWAGTDIQGVCCFGDLLAEAMKSRGCAGVVVDGGVRDVAHLRTMDLPVIARYRTPAQAIGRWRVTDHQVPIRVRGALEDWITVHPNDIVVADDDGVIVVPARLLADVTARVEEWSEKESGAREEIRTGLALLDALEKYGHL